MSFALYISHPDVSVDPAVPVPQWRLSETGRHRACAFAQRVAFPPGTQLFSSAENKALDLAQILSAAHGLPVHVHPDMGENDRSATGYLSAKAFERHVAAFFSRPRESINGWERAADAQVRIVDAVRGAAAQHPEVPLVFCGHGGVGTLLKCALARRPVALAEDQREAADPRGGNCFAFDLAAASLICDWTAMEQYKGMCS